MPADAQFRWFLAGQACWFAAFGLQAVMFPFLTVNVLAESPDRVGLAQMCLMAPAIALMVPGGMLADALDLRLLIGRLQLLAMLPVGLLAWRVSEGGLTYELLIVFALAHGCIQALVTPTRDALLGRVSGSRIQRAVTAAMAVQFLAQMVGFAVASTAGAIGAAWALAFQTLLYGLGAIAAFSLRPAPPIGHGNPAGRARPAMAGLGAAAAQVVRSPRLGPLTLVMVGVGLFFISTFSVLVPIMVRDLHGGGAAELALVNACFVAGVLLATIGFSRRAPVARQGLTIFLAAAGGVVLVALFAVRPPQWLFYAMILVFGAGAGVIITLGRTVVQETAEPALRARVLAIYSVAFLGAAPLGSLVMGQLAAYAGVLQAALFAALGMAVLLAGIGRRGTIFTVCRDDRAGAGQA